MTAATASTQQQFYGDSINGINSTATMLILYTQLSPSMLLLQCFVVCFLFLTLSPIQMRCLDLNRDFMCMLTNHVAVVAVLFRRCTTGWKCFIHICCCTFAYKRSKIYTRREEENFSMVFHNNEHTHIDLFWFWIFFPNFYVDHFANVTSQSGIRIWAHFFWQFLLCELL